MNMDAGIDELISRLPLLCGAMFYLFELIFSYRFNRGFIRENPSVAALYMFACLVFGFVFDGGVWSGIVLTVALLVIVGSFVVREMLRIRSKDPGSQ